MGNNSLWPSVTDVGETYTNKRIMGKTLNKLTSKSCKHSKCGYNGVVVDEVILTGSSFYQCLLIKNWIKRVETDTSKESLYDKTTGEYNNDKPQANHFKLSTVIDSNVGSVGTSSYIYTTIFENMIFNNVEFASIKFFDAAFIRCAFIDCTLVNCLFAGETVMTGCSFSGTDFINVVNDNKGEILSGCTFSPYTILGPMSIYCSPHDRSWEGYYKQRVEVSTIYNGVPVRFADKSTSLAKLVYSNKIIDYKEAGKSFIAPQEVTKPAAVVSRKPILFASAGV